MKLCLISDIHADSRLFGVSRFVEVEAAMIESVRIAIERGCDAFCFLGDLCDPDSGVSVFRCIRLAVQCVERLRAHRIRPIFVAGNHDAIEDSSGETTLEPLKAISPHVVYDRPEWTALGPSGTGPESGTVPCLVLPFTPASHAVDAASYVIETWDKATEGCRDVVVLTHLSLKGALLGSESAEMARGREVTYPAQEIEKLAAERNQVLHQFAGHYHTRQRVGSVQVVGAPVRFAYGEKDNSPGFLLAEVG
jgi:hypothetical protein